MQQQQPQSIQLEIVNQKNETSIYSFDAKILNFNIQYLNNNHNQPYPIPKNILTSIKPLQIMKTFVIAHNFQPSSVKITKPLKSSNYAQNVDPITFNLFSKYCDQKNAQQAAQVISLARFIRFHQLSDSISSAIATNYYIGNTDKQLQQFQKNNKLEDLSSEQIYEIIKNNQKLFKLIELKTKQELLKIQQADALLQS